MEIKHPSYYKKLRQARKRASAQGHKPAKAQADKPASAQASSGSRTNKR